MDQIVSKLVQKAGRALVLESPQLVQVRSKLVRVCVAGTSVLTHFVPDGVDVGNFVFKEKLICESTHDFFNLHI